MTTPPIEANARSRRRWIPIGLLVAAVLALGTAALLGVTSASRVQWEEARAAQESRAQLADSDLALRRRITELEQQSAAQQQQLAEARGQLSAAIDERDRAGKESQAQEADLKRARDELAKAQSALQRTRECLDGTAAALQLALRNQAAAANRALAAVEATCNAVQ